MHFITITNTCSYVPPIPLIRTLYGLLVGGNIENKMFRWTTITVYQNKDDGSFHSPSDMQTVWLDINNGVNINQKKRIEKENILVDSVYTRKISNTFFYHHMTWGIYFVYHAKKSRVVRWFNFENSCMMPYGAYNT